MLVIHVSGIDILLLCREDQCQGRIPISETNYTKLTNIISELQDRVFYYKDQLLEDPKACLKPCREILVHSMFKMEIHPSMPQIGLKFSTTVKYTRYISYKDLFHYSLKVLKISTS